MSRVFASPEGLSPSSTVTARHAFVTLVTNSDYALGARALLRSIRLTRTPADIVVLHTGGVDAASLEPLTEFDCRLIQTDLLPLSDEFNARHQRRNVHEQHPSQKDASPISIRRSTISAR